MNELPSIQTSTYGSATTALNSPLTSGHSVLNSIWDANPEWATTNTINQIKKDFKTEEKKPMPSRRLVKVIIVDPNESVPLDKAVLVNDPEMVTDLTDDEIFFDMDIKGILAAHNAYRITLVDKKASRNKEKDVMLEPIRIRNLKMVVLNIADF